MKLQTLSPPSRIVFPVVQGRPPYRQYALMVCLLYVSIASVLAVRIRYGVMDEDFHLSAIRAFAQGGVTKATLYHHLPPTGVSSHIWFALWLRLFPGIDYVGLRLISCVALGVLAVFAFSQLASVRLSVQKTVLAATLFMLAFPYFFLSVSTLMTEGPSLLFLGAGLLFLFVSRFQRLLPFCLGCLLLGLTTIARFYFIPLLPTLFIVLLLSGWQQHRQYGVRADLTHRILLYFSVAISALPLGGLIFLWGGLTPPGFNQWSELRLGVSFNPFRPFSALAMVGIYTAPFVLLNVSWASEMLSRKMLVVWLAALSLALFRVNLFHDSLSIDTVYSGPIEHSLAWLQTKNDLLVPVGLLVLYGFGLSSLVFMTKRIMASITDTGFSNTDLLFSVVFVSLFIISQAFVGGNHPFYDRYLIHPWPFIGYTIASLFPRFLNPRTCLVVAGYTVLSILILAKWGF
ncbi:hypothetical protein [Spirosoma lituiforme]